MRNIAYDLVMATHTGAQFGQALDRAIKKARLTQAKLAIELSVNPSQVSRWKNGESIPHIETVAQIEKILNADLSGALEGALPVYELYVSAPITGLGQRHVKAHHYQIAEVVEVLRAHVNSLYWPGEGIETAKDLEAADIATLRNLNALEQSTALLYLQFRETHRPSSSLVELGLALGMRHKTTMIVHEDLAQPFMFTNGFGAVAAELDFLPKARTYTVTSVAGACELIERNGRGLLGLD